MVKVLAFDVSETLQTGSEHNDNGLGQPMIDSDGEIIDGAYSVLIGGIQTAQLLQDAQKRGIQIVLVTNNGDDLDKAVIERTLNFLKRYGVIVQPENYLGPLDRQDGSKVPRLQKILIDFNINQDELMFFDDSLNNVTEAQEAGFRAIRVMSAADLQQGIQAALTAPQVEQVVSPVDNDIKSFDQSSSSDDSSDSSFDEAPQPTPKQPLSENDLNAMCLNVFLATKVYASSHRNDAIYRANLFEFQRHLPGSLLPRCSDLYTQAKKDVDARGDLTHVQRVIEFKKMYFNSLNETIGKKFEKAESFKLPSQVARRALPESAHYRQVEINHHTESFLNRAKALLNDYSEGQSFFSGLFRFCKGKWNRHHIEDVSRIVRAIDSGVITDRTDLLLALNVINLENPNGALARRIQFIENMDAGNTLAHKNSQTASL